MSRPGRVRVVLTPEEAEVLLRRIQGERSTEWTPKDVEHLRQATLQVERAVKRQQ
jgi:hypothetical protein